MDVVFSSGLVFSIAIPAFIAAHLFREAGFRRWRLAALTVVAFLVGWVGGGWIFVTFVHEGDARSGVSSVMFGGFWVALGASIIGATLDRKKPGSEPKAEPEPEPGNQLGLSKPSMVARKFDYKYVWLVAVVAATVYGAWWIVTPQSFEECVQKNLKNAHTTASVQAIHRTCQTQHGR